MYEENVSNDHQTIAASLCDIERAMLRRISTPGSGTLTTAVRKRKAEGSVSNELIAMIVIIQQR